MRSDKPKRKTQNNIFLRFIVFIFVSFSSMLFLAYIDSNNIKSLFYKSSLAKNTTKQNTNRVSEAEKKLFNSLKSREEELKLERKLIEEERSKIEEEKNILNQKLSEVKKIKEDLEKINADRLFVENGRLEKMVATFVNMKPAQAANVLETMDIDLVVKLIDKMDAKKVAPIMDKMKNEKINEIASTYSLLKDKGIKE